MTNRTTLIALLLGAAIFTPLVVAQTDVTPAAPPADAAVAEEPTSPLVEEAPIPTKNLLQVIRDGGPLMVPIGICSFILLVFVFERAISLRRGRVIPGPFVRRFLEQLRDEIRAIKALTDKPFDVRLVRD